MSTKYLIDPFNLPIYGQKLIQASAGTGKTYLLIILYVRLLLGLSYKESYQGFFTVKQILLLTFSDNLTKSLKIKIKKLISKLKLACVSNISNNRIITEFLVRIPDRFKAFILLDSAEKQFNEASILNIKTFCRRVLLKYAYTENIEYQLLNENKFILTRIISNFWEEHVEGIKKLTLYKLIISYWANEKVFIKFIEPLLKIKNLKLKKRFNSTLLLEEVYNKNILILLKIKKILKNLTLDKLINISNIWQLNKKNFYLQKIEKIYKKITIWIKSKKNIYSIPIEIRYLSLSYLKKHSNIVIMKNIIGYNIFARIDYLLKKIVDIKTFFVHKTIIELKKKINIEKDKKLQFTYNDIFKLTEKIALHSSKKITDQYPIVLIDEFQDFNRHQINIFYQLYILQKLNNIVLVADPKQSIYNFMGADISLYFTVKRCIKDVYKMKINWRSSDQLINNINWLFSQINNVFILRNIRFENISHNRLKKSFNINGVEQKAFTFWYYTNTDNINGIQSNIYRQIMAKQCAFQIKDWLLLISQNKAKIILNNKIRNLTQRDIVILVRNKIEADLIKRELSALQIQSIYSSSNENIFMTIEAYELLNLLQFISYYQHTNTHKYIENNNILSISSLPQKNEYKGNQSLLELTVYYKKIWDKSGILCMLKTFCKKERIWLNLLDYPNNKSILENILNLGEILQENYFKNPEPTYILRWLENKIIGNNYYEPASNIRCCTKKTIAILSIHKSKGLQFPIVCLPFISDYTQRKNNVYYNSRIKKFVLDLEDKKKVNYLSNKDRLAEDLRLLYVALNRAILHCCIGISPITKYGKKKHTDFHNNAIGYLLQQKNIFTAVKTNLLLEKISIEKNRTISVVWLINNLLYYNPNNSLINKTVNNNIYSNKSLINTKYYVNKHNINSVTNLISYTYFYKKLLSNNIDYYNSYKTNLPNGINIGKLLHYLLEKIKFEVPVQKKWLNEELRLNGYYNKLFSNDLYKWLNNILIYPFNNNRLNLANISQQPQMRELNFAMSIRQQFKIKDLNILFYKYINKTIFLPEDTVIQDHFNGIIDLVFFWEGKYYILDYKSNYLGDKKDNYKKTKLKEIIDKKYYWIQYHFYTLAMHRYLMIKFPKYDYKRDFGGVYYFFISAAKYLNKKYTFDKKNLINNYGIVYIYPDYKLINELNLFFC